MYKVAQYAFSKLSYLRPVRLPASTAKCSVVVPGRRWGPSGSGVPGAAVRSLSGEPCACCPCESLASPTRFQHKPTQPEPSLHPSALSWETKTVQAGIASPSVKGNLCLLGALSAPHPLPLRRVVSLTTTAIHETFPSKMCRILVCLNFANRSLRPESGCAAGKPSTRASTSPTSPSHFSPLVQFSPPF